MKTTAIVCVLVVSTALPARGVEDKYEVTAAEQNACGNDAVSFCSGVGQDEDKLLACMKANRAKLSAGCRPVFDEGLRRRGLR